MFRELGQKQMKNQVKLMIFEEGLCNLAMKAIIFSDHICEKEKTVFKDIVPWLENKQAFII